MVHKFNLILIIAACAVITSLFPAWGQSTCANGAKLDTYIALGSTGCEIGDKIFSDFQYTPSATGAGTFVPATGVTVDTLGPTSGTLFPAGQSSLFFPGQIGLQFGGTWNSPSGGSSSDGLIQFEVTVVNGAGMNITDAGIFQTSGVTGAGLAQVTEKGCPTADCTNLTIWGVLTKDDAPKNDTMFSPTGSIVVAKDITTSVGRGTTGTASISGVQDLFSQSPVPEPRAISMLLGLGLIAGLAFRKRFQSLRG